MFALKPSWHRLPSASPAVRTGPIGVDFSLEQVHLVQLEAREQGELRLRARASLAYPLEPEALLASPKALRSLVRRALKAEPFQGREAVSTLPPAQVRILSIAYHAAGGDDAGAIVRQLEERLDGPMADYVVDYLPVRTGKGEEERLAMVAVARHSAVIRHLDLLRGAGFEPRALEIGPAAIKRLIGTLAGRTDPATVLVVNFGRTMSYLTMISGRRLLFDQAVEFGEEGLLQQLSEALDLSSERSAELVLRHGLDARAHGRGQGALVSGREVSETLVEIVKPRFLKLVDEINRTLIYAASETRGEPVRRVYLLGGIARWKGADTLLGTLLDIPVSTIPDPLRPFRPRRDHLSEPGAMGVPEIAVATGLALRGMEVDA